MPLEITARKTVLEEELEIHCSGLILAVSGGADSMAMLAWYASRSLPFPIVAVHIHHGLRPESEAEAELVKDFCHRLALPCRIFRTDVRKEMLPKETVESAARRLRYAFLRQAAREEGASHIATAHTLDDQAETVLLHLIHGAGLNGLCGILPKRQEADRILIRPLLRCTRADTEDFCARQSIPFVLDPSNEDRSYTRNRIRHEILPKLREINPNITATVGRTATALQMHRAAAEERAEAFLKDAPQDLSVSRLTTLSKGDRAEVLRLWFARRGKDLSAEQTGQALSLLEKREGTVEFDRRWRLHLGQNRLSMEEILPADPFPPRTVTGDPIHLPDGRTLRLAPLKANKENRNTLLSLPLPLTLRTRRNGDKIRTPGGTKSLAKRMAELHIPLFERDTLLLLADGSHVLWCEGVGAAHQTAPEEGCEGYFITLSEE